VTLPAPTFDRVTRDPVSWRGNGFEVRDANDAFLFALPPTVGLRDGMGTPDPYEWDRAPGSVAWFPLGDGIGSQRPLVRLDGQWSYRTLEEAMLHTATIEELLPRARSLYWRGSFVTLLDLRFPGSVLMTSGARFVDTTYAVTLNTTVPVTRRTLTSIFPLGKLRVTSLSGGIATVEPLTGVTLQTTTFTLSGANGAAFTFPALEASYG